MNTKHISLTLAILAILGEEAATAKSDTFYCPAPDQLKQRPVTPKLRKELKKEEIFLGEMTPQPTDREEVYINGTTTGDKKINVGFSTLGDKNSSYLLDADNTPIHFRGALTTEGQVTMEGGNVLPEFNRSLECFYSGKDGKIVSVPGTIPHGGPKKNPKDPLYSSCSRRANFIELDEARQTGKRLVKNGDPKDFPIVCEYMDYPLGL